jgi:hypothetical protein
MLKLLDGEDLTGIDINTDEGKGPFINDVIQIYKPLVKGAHALG